MSAQTLWTSLPDYSIQTVPKSTTQGWFPCLALLLFSESVPQPYHWSQSHWQRSHRLRAVSESTPALKKPEVASKPQIKEASAGNKPEPAEQEPRYQDTVLGTSAVVCTIAGSHSCPCCCSNQVTIQYQREQAKAMRKYFKSLAYSEEVVKSK